MSIKSIDLLNLAENLLDGSSCEPSYRNAISCAYYAVYHKAKEFHDALISPGALGCEGGVHAQLASRLMNPTISDSELSKKSKIAGYICKDMHGRRVDADYELSRDITHDHVLYSVNSAKNLFERLK